MIDQAIGRHHEKGGPAAADQLPDAATLAAGPATISVHPPVARDGPDRLILLTRTLSGLVDLIIVAACTLGVIAATDFVTGIGEVDLRSALVYAALLVLVFLLYSVFFMGTANQTIGMMITDLRVLSDEGTRPAFRKVLGRSVAYMLSLAPAGIGLLWGCFDRDCRCWHDRMSGTRVGRVL